MNNSEWRKCQDPQAMRFELHARAPNHIKAESLILDSPLNLSYCYGSAVSNTNTMCKGYPGSHECASLHCDILRMAYPTIEDVADDVYAPFIKFVDEKVAEVREHAERTSMPSMADAIFGEGTAPKVGVHIHESLDDALGCEACRKPFVALPPTAPAPPPPPKAEPESLTIKINVDTEEAQKKIKFFADHVRELGLQFEAARVAADKKRELRAIWLSIAIRLALIFLVLSPILYLCINGILGPFGLVHITYWQVASAVLITTVLAGFFSKDNN